MHNPERTIYGWTICPLEYSAITVDDYGDADQREYFDTLPEAEAYAARLLAEGATVAAVEVSARVMATRKMACAEVKRFKADPMNEPDQPWEYRFHTLAVLGDPAAVAACGWTTDGPVMDAGE